MKMKNNIWEIDVLNAAADTLGVDGYINLEAQLRDAIKSIQERL